MFLRRSQMTSQDSKAGVSSSQSVPSASVAFIFSWACVYLSRSVGIKYLFYWGNSFAWRCWGCIMKWMKKVFFLDKLSSCKLITTGPLSYLLTSEGGGGGEGGDHMWLALMEMMTNICRSCWQEIRNGNCRPRSLIKLERVASLPFTRNPIFFTPSPSEAKIWGAFLTPDPFHANMNSSSR